MSNPITVTLLVLTADQWLKIWVKTHMMLGNDFPVFGNWFYIHFIENKGMAFGMEFGGDWGKLALSLFRIVAVFGIGYYLFKVLPKDAHKGLKISVSLIFAGAIGNILDSMFYGVIFTDSFNQIARFMPEEGGYAPFLYGWVVDMFWFPLMEGNFPDWLPIWGGEHFMFFRPVFNVADMSISVGIGLVFLFNKQFFKKEEEVDKKEELIEDQQQQV
ncbi:MAG: lipoprotein signal peptidase [Flavobacteriales bacterium]|nr:lipoprotein signal peptidase [Flavobacteriales bacterium]